ncbi:hypothetical protein [Glutamicibacter sp. PS]|uniref:hypothetical protein n=1 Tax=Glutamicibacter sp. PS TaxID=3075634 RepID=UPI002846DDF5|nr:hypothetical protein [Glutamicibacter sp. PS]MDR4534454.1 hypothetical protein [Glutamicibacter sp. PS]
MKRLLATAAVAALSVLGAVAPASAAPPAGAVCPGWDTGHLGAGGATSTTITAPDGMVITGVCVKAGSAQQGNGPEITYYDPGVTSVTIWHSSGKQISHYSVMYSEGGPSS